MTKKEIEIEITQKQCDELNTLQNECFKGLTQRQKDLIGVKEYKPCKLKCLFG